MEMNRGRIGPGAKAGHVHRLEDAANVIGEDKLADGMVLVFLDGAWRPRKLSALIAEALQHDAR